MELEQIGTARSEMPENAGEADAVVRRILCVFPRYTRSLGTFNNAYPLLGV